MPPPYCPPAALALIQILYTYQASALVVYDAHIFFDLFSDLREAQEDYAQFKLNSSTTNKNNLVLLIPVRKQTDPGSLFIQNKKPREAEDKTPLGYLGH